MLKIRISGTEDELRKVAHKAGNTRIKRFKRDNGKTTFAIDVQISVSDFVENLDLNTDDNETNQKEIQTQSNKAIPETIKESCNPKEIQTELENLLGELLDETSDDRL